MVPPASLLFLHLFLVAHLYDFFHNNFLHDFNGHLFDDDALHRHLMTFMCRSDNVTPSHILNNIPEPRKIPKNPS